MKGGILMKQLKITFLKMTVLGIGLFFLLLCIFLGPLFESQRWLTNPDYADVKFVLHIGLYVTLIPFFVALYKTFKLLQSIERKNAFSKRNVYALGSIKNCAFTIITLYGIALIYLAIRDAMQNGIVLTAVVVLLATLVIAIFSMILQELLKSVMTLKSENDLTV